MLHYILYINTCRLSHIKYIIICLLIVYILFQITNSFIKNILAKASSPALAYNPQELH